MKRTVCLCVLLFSATSVVYAEVGDLTPVADSAGEALFSEYLYARGSNAFTKRTEGGGTVNEHAMIATIKSGQDIIKMAIDTRSPETKSPDVARFDFTGKGQFDDKSVVPLKVRSRGQSFQGAIGPATIQVQHNGRTIPVSVHGMYYKGGNSRYLRIRLGTALQGTCRFGEKTLRIRIIDGNNNLQCTNKSSVSVENHSVRGIIPGDTMLINQAGDAPAHKVLLGQSVKIGEEWYLPEISADGSKISSKPVEVKTGKIRIDHKRWSATLVSTKHLLALSGGDEVIEVPAGSYAIIDYVEYGQNNKERLICRGREAMRGKGKVFEVPEGKVTDIAVGSAIKAGVNVRVNGRRVNFTLKLTDASGSSVDNVTPSPPPPVIEVFDTSGNQVHSGKMEYG